MFTQIMRKIEALLYKIKQSCEDVAGNESSRMSFSIRQLGEKKEEREEKKEHDFIMSKRKIWVE